MWSLILLREASRERNRYGGPLSISIALPTLLTTRPVAYAPPCPRSQRRRHWNTPPCVPSHWPSPATAGSAWTVWLMLEDLQTGRLKQWNPEPVVIRASRAVDNGVWFDVLQGVRAVLVRDRQTEAP
jgi:hypothetical protein